MRLIFVREDFDQSTKGTTFVDISVSVKKGSIPFLAAGIRRLEKRYRLHIVQVAGFAGSPSRANAAGPVIGPTVDAIDAYLKGNHLRTPKVIGHSVGGLMAMTLALKHPEDVGKLMVVDALPFLSVLFGAKDAAAAGPQAAAMRGRHSCPDARGLRANRRTNLAHARQITPRQARGDHLGGSIG